MNVTDANNYLTPNYARYPVEFARGQAAQLPIDDPASRCGPGEQARRRSGPVEERAHPVEVVVVSTKRRLGRRTDHRIDQAQGDATPLPTHLDVAPRIVTTATAASGPM